MQLPDCMFESCFKPLILCAFHQRTSVFSLTGELSIINWVDNLNWPLYRVLKLMFQALALHQSKRQRAGTQDISFKALYGGQFTLSTQLIILNYPVILSHPCITTDIFFRNLPLLFFSLILLYKQCSGFAILLKFNLIQQQTKSWCNEWVHQEGGVSERLHWNS